MWNLLVSSIGFTGIFVFCFLFISFHFVTLFLLVFEYTFDFAWFNSIFGAHTQILCSIRFDCFWGCSGLGFFFVFIFWGLRHSSEKPFEKLSTRNAWRYNIYINVNIDRLRWRSFTFLFIFSNSRFVLLVFFVFFLSLTKNSANGYSFLEE